MSTHVAARLWFSTFALVFVAQNLRAQPRAPQQTAATSADALIETLRRAPQSGKLRWFASTDPKGRNEDYLLLKPNETRRIPLAAGTLTRLWCTALKPEKIALQLQNGGASSVLLRDNRALQGELYEKAFTFYPTAKMPSATRDLKSGATLIVKNLDSAPNKFFYQASVREKTSVAPATLSFAPYAVSQGSNISTILPAGTNPYPLDFPGDDSGIIDEIRISLSPASDAVLSHLRLRIHRSAVAMRGKQNTQLIGDRETLVDAPLSALLGVFDHARPTKNAMSSFDGKTVILRWPIPYDRRYDALEIELENEGAQAVRVSCGFKLLNNRTIKNPPPYLFHAVYGSSRSQKGVPIPILKATGSGFFVGLNLRVAPRKDSSRRSFAFLEGNETAEADGVKYEGTGTEDFFNSAWYFPDKPFDKLFHGLSFKQLEPPQIAAYRLMIPDAVPFAKSLNFTFEHGNGNKSDDLEWRWVAFWYQKRTDGAPNANTPPFQIADNLAQDAERERVAAAKAKAEAKAQAQRRKLLGVWSLAALVALISVVLLRLSSRRPPANRSS